MKTPSPTTPAKRGRGRKPHSDISVESPYFSPSKERPPRPKGEIVERRLTAYTDRSLDSPDDPFTQTQMPASPASVSGLYRQLALCKPCLIQGVLSLS